MRYAIIQDILTKKPEYICIGLLMKDEIEYLRILNLLGIIKHILFLNCDAVECYIHCIWS